MFNKMAYFLLRAKKEHSSVELQTHGILMTSLRGGQRLASRLAHFNPEERPPPPLLHIVNQLNTKLGGFHSPSRRFGRQKVSARIKPRSLGYAAYSLYWLCYYRINSPIFWDDTQRKLVWHRRFGTTYRSHLQGTLKFGTDTWSRNVGAKPTYAA